MTSSRPMLLIFVGPGEKGKRKGEPREKKETKREKGETLRNCGVRETGRETKREKDRERSRDTVKTRRGARQRPFTGDRDK